jgi:hypothetical protein
MPHSKQSGSEVLPHSATGALESGVKTFRDTELSGLLWKWMASCCCCSCGGACASTALAAGGAPGGHCSGCRGEWLAPLPEGASLASNPASSSLSCSSSISHLSTGLLVLLRFSSCSASWSSASSRSSRALANSDFSRKTSARLLEDVEAAVEIL